MRTREDVYRAVFEANFPALLGYALRRTASAPDAADVASETMLVAWRRFDEMPGGGETRLWLYGVARRVLANHHRGEERRERLGAKFAERLADATAGADPACASDLDATVRAALAGLSPQDREVLALTAWEGLAPREVAAVLGLSPDVVRTRLHRARGRLRTLLGDSPGHDARASGHEGVDELTLVRKEDQR